MKEITVGKKKYVLGFTFNSFRFMKDFDLSQLDELQTKPFSFVEILETLFFGAINNSRKRYYSQEESFAILDDYVEQTEDGGLELFNNLLEMLEESDFFKNLQTKEA